MMNVAARKITIAEESGSFAADVLRGLKARRKAIPPKYFYDAEGSPIFEQITALPEYYPTRTEIGILSRHAAEISALMPRGSALIEFGSGATAKMRILLEANAPIEKYVPVDISADFLRTEASALQRDWPALSVHPVAVDFTRPFTLPAPIAAMPHVGFFPGSTIGNFEPKEALSFLRLAARVLGPGSPFIIGADLDKAEAVLHSAYNDAAGVTARFNLNLLRRINRELAGDFDLTKFVHRAFYNRQSRRIEMHLVSLESQTVHVLGQSFAFRAGETIHTENSHKFSVKGLQKLLRQAGFVPKAAWTDAARYFSVQAFVVASRTRRSRGPSRRNRN
jgi:dimethylhistidine N-methyltransferase